MDEQVECTSSAQCRFQLNGVRNACRYADTNLVVRDATPAQNASERDPHTSKPSPNTLARRTQVKTTPAATQNLFLLNQLCPASRAALPSWTTAPTPALPPSRLLNAAASGEHCNVEPVASGSMRPVAGSILFSFIHSQFSASSSGHSNLNLAPPSPALILPTPFAVGCTPGVGFDADPPPVEFHHFDLAAYHLLSVSDAPILPVVISSLVMKDMRPTSIVDTDQAGLKDLG